MWLYDRSVAFGTNGIVVDIAEAGFRVKNGRSWAIRKLTNLQIRN
jgi:hypothetical protein